MEQENLFDPPPMPETPLKAKPSQQIVRWILAVSIGLGIAADCLLRSTPWGLNVPCFAVLLALAIGWDWRRQTQPGSCWPLLATFCLLSLGIALRDAPVLFWLNLGTMGLLMLFLVARPTRSLINTGALTSLLTNAGRALGSCLVGPFQLSSDLDWSECHARPQGTLPKTLIRALVLTAPVLIVFAWLFSAADAVFKSTLESLGQTISQLADHSQTAALHAGWSLVFFVAATMILRPLCLGKQWTPDHIRPPASWAVGTVEIATVLGSLCALFLCFIIIQLRYLFGGTALVQSVAGLTYADYARQGFFALLKVVFLLHMVLMAGSWLVKQSDHSTQVYFRWLSLGLIALTVFVFASAFFRLSLYVEAYGLTRARLYAVAVLVWLALVFLFFAAKLLWPTWSLFTGAYIHAFLGVLLILNGINPDAMIARINLDRFVTGQALDQTYLGTLSCDSISTIVQYSDHLSDQDIGRLIDEIVSHRPVPAKPDWRAWNYGRSYAHEQIASSRVAPQAQFQFFTR